MPEIVKIDFYGNNENYNLETDKEEADIKICAYDNCENPTQVLMHKFPRKTKSTISSPECEDSNLNDNVYKFGQA